MAEAEEKRLNKVAKELNVGLATIVEFLADKGHSIDKNPNSKITPDVYTILLKQFASDKVAKEESQKIGVKKVAKETLSIEDERPAKKESPQKEQSEILIKDINAVSETLMEQTAPSKTIEKPTEEAPPEIPETAKKEDEIGVKVLGKIDLASMNLKTKPGKKEKETPAKKEPKKTAKGKKTTDAEIEEVPTEDVPVVVPTPEIEPVVEKEVEKKEDDVIRAKAETLQGPTILGKIVLPVKDDKKKPVASSTVGFGADKKKRKRIKKGAIDTNKVQGENKPGQTTPRTDGGGGVGRPYPQNRTGGGSFKPRPGGGSGPIGPKPELTDEEIQKQIKETLARLSGSGKSKSSKFRREKRSEIRQEAEERQQREAEESKVLKVTEFISANELAKMMDVPVTKIISTCMSLGMFVSINQRLSAEVISIVSEEFGYTVEFVTAEAQMAAEEAEQDKPEDLKYRAPIVTVMGHVDHGKTSLLDYIRKANVIAGEAGGITQHIGAYSVQLENGKRIAFLDTPGHEAFTAMRARGAQVTDIVIVVVAADDNVMPQTKEAINHAQAAGVPIVFAFNKMDKEGANADKIREQLSAMNILVEEWGGKYQTQEVSAKKGLNVDLLLEKVLLEAEILDLKANANRLATGTIIESSLDKGRGYVATIMVQNGTLRVGDIVLAGSAYGRVKAMQNERGAIIKEAGPSTPVQLLGLNGAPQAGDKFKVYSDEREAKEIATKRQQIVREQGIRTHKHITLDEIGRRLAIGDFKELNIIVKGDVDGSIEALTDSLLKLSTDNVQVNVIHKSVGQVSESDVMLASASNAIIVAFQVRPSAAARKLAEQEEIDIRMYSIIYDAINEVKTAMEGMLAPEFEEKIVCNIEVRDVFKITKVGTIAGCMVLDGKVNRNTKVRVIRDGIVIHTGSLGSLKRFKDDVKEVAAGFECGLNIDNFNDIQVGDIIEGFESVEVKKKL